MMSNINDPAEVGGAISTADSPLETLGHTSGETIPVQISTRFLEHFSKQLYSSPQKAFEELISNGWDAGADVVDVRVPDDLKLTGATMCVLDNGMSMDAAGLKDLWHIAFSTKTESPVRNGRPLIGKFGIGKLATYVLADKLTYICRPADGIIRRVTMDYSTVDDGKGGSADRLINNQSLEIFEVSEEELESALQSVADGSELLALIKKGIPKPSAPLSEDEYNSPEHSFVRASTGTWTLAVLSGLKPAGRDMKVGILRRMLEAALPVGSELAISVNGELLSSSKIALSTVVDWKIGEELSIDSIDIAKDSDGELSVIGDDDESPSEQETQAEAPVSIPVTSGPDFVEIPGIGRITGRVRLFEDKISSGKSLEQGDSNGFFINVLGRVVNQDDNSFGEKNLSHAAWSRFRMAVRADGLNKFLTINREQFQEVSEIKVFRAFLRKVFNKIRTQYDSDPRASLPDGGDVLVRSLGVLSLSPLRNVVSQSLASDAQLPEMFDDSGIDDREAKRIAWRENTAEHIQNALNEVKYERIGDESFAKFRISDNSIVVNKSHPFVEEHSRSKAEKELVRTIAMVNLLTDIYSLDIGISPDSLRDIRSYRDRLMRFKAMQSRKSGIHIASLLLRTQHVSDDSKQLEAVVSDALRYLGFQVLDLAKSGEPEGIAKAFPYPTFADPTAYKDPTDEEPHPPLYSFSFDAKSSKHDAAKTGNIKLDGVVEHRKRFKADYALIVAPDYQKGAMEVRCEQQKVTPIRASDLGMLLKYTVEYGAIPLTKLQELFGLYSPDEVADWVKILEQELKAKRKLTVDVFIKALERLKGKVPEALPASMITLEVREGLGVMGVRDIDVINLARGLAVLIPDLIGVDRTDRIIINASASHVASAIQVQLEKLQDSTPERTETSD